MDLWQLFLVLFCGLALTQSLFLSTTFLVKDKFSFGPLFYSAILLQGLALRLVKSIFIFIPLKYPHWGVVVGAAGLWMIGPAFYLYSLRSLDPNLKASPRQLLHFIPSALILTTGTTEYVYYIGLLQFLIYFALVFSKITKIGLSNLPKHLPVFTKAMALMLLCFALQALGGGIELYTVGAGLGITILYVINYFFVKDSEFFASFTRKSKALDKQLTADVVNTLSSIFSERKLYRHKGLTIAKVAQEANYPGYVISQSINQHHGLRFNEFVNKFRVSEAMERLRNDNDKIETIAKEVGFSSMSSLYDAFKKETGATPQEYRNRFSPLKAEVDNQVDLAK